MLVKMKHQNLLKKSLSLGHKICLDTKNVSGMINCPLDKTLLRKNFMVLLNFKLQNMSQK